MTGPQLRKARESARFTQQQAAARLSVSQSYLSMLERGNRDPGRKLARRVAALYGLPPELPPVDRPSTFKWTEDAAARQLGSLGYPGFSHLRCRRRHSPAELLYWALSQEVLDARVAETLPWLVLHYRRAIDWKWLIDRSKLNDRQNRLGFVVSVARCLADRTGAEELRRVEAALERSRLTHEDTFFEQAKSARLRDWLRGQRSPEARHWNMLTDFGPRKVRYVDAPAS